jgi:hypothetical protein
MRQKTFFYHYNKPASRAAKKPLMSVHFNKKCYVVDHIHCVVGAWTEHRKRQPFCVMKGYCMGIDISTRKDGLTQATIL